jgi:GTP-binding protein
MRVGRGFLARLPDGGSRRSLRTKNAQAPRIFSETRPAPGRFQISMAFTASHQGPTAGPRDGRKISASKGRLGREVRLVLAAHRAGERPAGLPLPVVAILGRSNVGKSSLLNALLGTRVARISSTPGRTQALYWYRVDEAFDLVDCPGYGFAKTSKETRQRLQLLIEGLLTGTPRPDAALLLVDGRLLPQESDRSMALFLSNAGVPTFVAATKWDAVRSSAHSRQRRALAGEFERDDRPLLAVSSETGENLNALARLLRDRVTAPPRGRLSSGVSAPLI